MTVKIMFPGALFHIKKKKKVNHTHSYTNTHNDTLNTQHTAVLS